VLVTVLVTQDMVLMALLAVLPRIFQAAEPVDAVRRGNHSIMEDIFVVPPPTSLEAWVQSQLVVTGLSFLSILLLCVFLRRQSLLRSVQAPSDSIPAYLFALDDEYFTLVSLSYAFLLSYMTDSLGLSVELGAFVAGLSLASLSPEVAKRAEHRLGGLKDVFAALFFGSIGFVVNARFLYDNLSAIISVVIFVFVLKAATAFLPLWLLATRKLPAPGLTALRLCCTLAHVGEFGFVLAARGSTLGVLSRHVYLLLIGANSVSLCLTPWMFQAVNWLLPEEEAFFLGTSRDPPKPKRLV